MGVSLTSASESLAMAIRAPSLTDVVRRLEELLEGSLKSDFTLPSPDEVMEVLSREGSYVVPLEDSLIKPCRLVRPHVVLQNKTLVGIDSSAFVFKGHPIRLVVARSAVSVYSQRRLRVLRVRNPYLYVVEVVQASGADDLEEEFVRTESRAMALAESRTAIDLASRARREIDAVFFDGPMYSRHTHDISLETLKELQQRELPSVHVVKNCSASRIMSLCGCLGLLDSDFFSYYLRPGFRSCFFLWKSVVLGDITVDAPSDLLPVYAYFMTWSRHLLRVEVPRWVFEALGPEGVEALVISDLLLGGRSASYLISRADRLARFSERERSMLEFTLRILARRLGFVSPEFFNQTRWWSVG